ncbi:MAG: SLATT domain-containing protein, partial [Candidatus Aminicenantes bacterium]|nr:SLATT domain-containing protein [Candidatus Aminicenantes bacterium]
YRGKTGKLAKKLKILHSLIYIFGGLGTLLAAVKLTLWVAVTTAIVGIFITFLEYKQVEHNLMIYNQAVTALSNLKTRWLALPQEQKKEQQHIRRLVEGVEQILRSEQSRWLENMETALERLHVKQSSKKDKRAQEEYEEDYEEGNGNGEPEEDYEADYEEDGDKKEGE